MRFAREVSRAVPMSVPLKADTVGPCRLTFGHLAVAGADEGAMSPADNALFFETADGSLGRVTFEGLDAIRASRGEVAPYDDGHDFSSWVYNVLDSAWLAERHAYEWSNYETPLLETHQHAPPNPRMVVAARAASFRTIGHPESSCHAWSDAVGPCRSETATTAVRPRAFRGQPRRRRQLHRDSCHASATHEALTGL